MSDPTPCQQHGERLASLERIASNNVNNIMDLTRIVTKVGTKQEVMAENLSNLCQRNDERHDETMKFLHSIHAATKETNGCVGDLKAWRQVHQEWTAHKEKEFTLIGQHVDEIESRQEEVRLLLHSATVKSGEDKRLMSWMWAAVISIGMPLIILVMNILAKGLEKHWGW